MTKLIVNISYALLFLLVVAAGGMSCNNKAGAPAIIAIKHQVEFKKPGNTLYVDIVPPEQIMKSKPGDLDKSFFYACRIGIVDNSPAADEKRKQEFNRYFEYEMVNDWKAIVHGDTVAAVFLQPVTSRNPDAREAVIVFELPKGTNSDSLVYTDHYGNWGKQIIPLTDNNIK